MRRALLVVIAVLLLGSLTDTPRASRVEGLDRWRWFAWDSLPRPKYGDLGGMSPTYTSDL